MLDPDACALHYKEFEQRLSVFRCDDIEVARLASVVSYTSLLAGLKEKEI
jgi:hypothetical protein